MDVLARLGTLALIVAVLVVGYRVHVRLRARRFAGWSFETSFPLLAIPTVLLSTYLADLLGAVTQQVWAGWAVTGVFNAGVIALLYLMRSELRWSEQGLVARRWPRRDFAVDWSEVQQAGISEVFRRVWIVESDGRYAVLGRSPAGSDLEATLALNLGDRFLGPRKPRPVGRVPASR